MPLLFLVYINDIAASIDPMCKVLLYADDCAILFSDPNPAVIEEVLGKCLESCSEWLMDNRLTMHCDKTECILFGTKRRLKKQNFELRVLGRTVKSSVSVKYLGVQIDQQVSGELIAKSVISKVNSRLKFLYRQSQQLDYNSRKLLSFALIQPIFDYASSSWFTGVSKNLTQKLQISQNKMARFISKSEPRTHVGQSELNDLGLLNVKNRATFLSLCNVYKIFTNTAPSYLTPNFKLLNNAHHHYTRSSSVNFRVPTIKGYADKTFYFTGIREWNKLPKDIKLSGSIRTFKESLKNHLRNLHV